jgi:hypothetical protein
MKYQHLVYALVDPRPESKLRWLKGRFYIGMSSSGLKRPYKELALCDNTNPDKNKVIRELHEAGYKCRQLVEVLDQCRNQGMARKLETKLIELARNSGRELTNIKSGGQGRNNKQTMEQGLLMGQGFSERMEKQIFDVFKTTTNSASGWNDLEEAFRHPEVQAIVLNLMGMGNKQRKRNAGVYQASSPDIANRDEAVLKAVGEGMTTRADIMLAVPELTESQFGNTVRRLKDSGKLRMEGNRATAKWFTNEKES